MNPNEVEILVSFGTWSSGFEIVDTHAIDKNVTMFRVRRQSDGEVLPVDLPAERIRPANSVSRPWS